MSNPVSFGDYPSNFSECNVSERSKDDLPFVPQKDTSLCRLSMVSLVTNLWSGGALDNDLQTVMMTDKTLYQERAHLIRKAADVLMKLELPASVTEKAIGLLEWISLDFFSYLDHLLSNEFYPFEGKIGDIIKDIKWDMHGGIDAVQSFRNMKLPNHLYNYFLSCLYCLEDDVVELWKHVSPVQRPIFTLKKINSRGFDLYASYIIYYWTCHAKKRPFPVQSLQDPLGLFDDILETRIELKMTVVSLHCHNIHSFKYFWSKLDQNERILALHIICDRYEVDEVRVSGNFFDSVKNNVDIILFVMSQFDNKVGASITRRCLPQMIVNFWQCWQVHHVILPMFKNYIDAVDESLYKQLFHMLASMKTSEYSPRIGLLYKMWLVSPPHLQNLITEVERHHLFLDNYILTDNRYEDS